MVAAAGRLHFPASIAGVVWLLGGPVARPWRALELAFRLELALTLVVNGKSYYSGFMPLVIATSRR